VSAYRDAVMRKDGYGLSKLPGETTTGFRFAFVNLGALGVDFDKGNSPGPAMAAGNSAPAAALADAAKRRAIANGFMIQSRPDMADD
jgi:hypothetical protein